MMTDNDTRFGPKDTARRDHAENANGPHFGHEADRREQDESHEAGGDAGHKWMMMACCVPMLAIAIALVVSGTAGAGVIILAIGCALMMAMMMGGMGGHGHGHGGGDGT